MKNTISTISAPVAIGTLVAPTAPPPPPPAPPASDNSNEKLYYALAGGITGLVVGYLMAYQSGPAAAPEKA